MNLWGEQERPSRVKMAAKWLYNWALAACGFARPRYSTSLPTFMGVVQRRALDSGVTVECVLHPGSQGIACEAELASSEWWAGLKQGIRLVSYRSV
jgi:hypothetical protein